MAAAANIYQTREARRENRLWTTATFVKSRSEQNTWGHLLGGSGEGGSANAELRSERGCGDRFCCECGARGSAPMVALREGVRDRVCGQGERQLNLGLV